MRSLIKVVCAGAALLLVVLVATAGFSSADEAGRHRQLLNSKKHKLAVPAVPVVVQEEAAEPGFDSSAYCWNWRDWLKGKYGKNGGYGDDDDDTTSGGSNSCKVPAKGRGLDDSFFGTVHLVNVVHELVRDIVESCFGDGYDEDGYIAPYAAMSDNSKDTSKVLDTCRATSKVMTSSTGTPSASDIMCGPHKDVSLATILQLLQVRLSQILDFNGGVSHCEAAKIAAQAAVAALRSRCDFGCAFTFFIGRRQYLGGNQVDGAFADLLGSAGCFQKQCTSTAAKSIFSTKSLLVGGKSSILSGDVSEIDDLVVGISMTDSDSMVGASSAKSGSSMSCSDDGSMMVGSSSMSGKGMQLSAAEDCSTGTGGVAPVTSATEGFMLELRDHPGWCLGVDTANPAKVNATNGMPLPEANLQLEKCNANDPYQIFRYTETGRFQLVNAPSLCIDNYANRRVANNNIQVWTIVDTNVNQEWTHNATGHICYTLPKSSQWCIGVRDGPVADGANIVLKTFNLTSSLQIFAKRQLAVAMQVSGDGRCADASAGPGETVTLQTCNPTKRAQQWQWMSSGHIQSFLYPGYCMAYPKSKLAKYGEIILALCDANAEGQKFAYGCEQKICLASNWCLDSKGSKESKLVLNYATKATITIAAVPASTDDCA